MNLRTIYELLREEYAPSRHIVWIDDAGRQGTDVTHTLRLVVAAAQELRKGKESAWRELVTYALRRSMSAGVMIAIDEYLSSCGDLAPLPLITLDEERCKVRIGRSTNIQYFDSTTIPRMRSYAPRPEPDRELFLKGEAGSWTNREPRIRDEYPAPERKQQAARSQHWLFV